MGWMRGKLGGPCALFVNHSGPKTQRGGSSVSFPIFTNRPHITSSCTRERAIQVRSVRIRGRITTSSLSAIRPQSASFNWSFQLPEPDLSFPMRSSYWRQYESDGDMRISVQLAQMRSPPGLGERRLECEAV
jgi:hypothetical protein